MSSADLSWADDTLGSACTLPSTERPLRVAEFDALFSESLAEVSRPAATTAVLTLRGGPRLAEQAADLAERESACCSFFTFSVTPAADRSVTLTIDVPTAHVATLDALVARAVEQSPRA